MTRFLAMLSGATIAVFLARALLGILFLMAGWWKVFTLSLEVHAQRFFIEGFKDHWIPEWLLYLLGVSIPLFELVAGLALLVGVWTRGFAALTGLLLLLTTYGHALQQPLFDIDGHTFTRFALVIFVLMLADAHDRLSLDAWRAGRKKG